MSAYEHVRTLDVMEKGGQRPSTNSYARRKRASPRSAIDWRSRRGGKVRNAPEAATSRGQKWRNSRRQSWFRMDLATSGGSRCLSPRITFTRSWNL